MKEIISLEFSVASLLYKGLGCREFHLGQKHTKDYFLSAFSVMHIMLNKVREFLFLFYEYISSSLLSLRFTTSH